MDAPQNTRTKCSSDEGCPSHTHTEQVKTEQSCLSCFENQLMRDTDWKQSIALSLTQHRQYLLQGFYRIPNSYESLDASRPWLVFWILHSLELLHHLLTEDTINRVVSFLSHCQAKSGGFGGGPGQIPHLAPTYSAVHALMICGTEEAYNCIDRKGLYRFMMRMKRPSGGFTMQENGEVDVRATYCALTVASLLNLLTDELTAGVAEWVASCQTYEGGIGGEPFNEAHGGYAFCGLATLVILGKTHLLDLRAFLRWAVKRQMRVEGGFQGRSNKLVDGCYSFWQGGLFPLLDQVLINPKKYETPVAERCDNPLGDGGWCFNQLALQEYLLACCQSSFGGLVDKPGKRPDYYHTCYTLSGMSVAQHNPYYLKGSSVVFGDPNNLLQENNALHNISPEAVVGALAYFAKFPKFTLAELDK